MLYSRPLWPVLLWLAFMLTASSTEQAYPNQTGPDCPAWLQPEGNTTQLRKYLRDFNQILARFDCPQPYSVKFQCHQCKEAYMEWVCTSVFRYQWVDRNNERRKVKPCRSFCHRVEQKCPFFLPLDKGPVHYAGEPTFLCLDPNIEETGEQLKKSSYGPPTCCYDVCGSGVCVQGTCDEEKDNKRSSSRSGSRRDAWPSPIAPLLAPLLLYRTRLLLI